MTDPLTTRPDGAAFGRQISPHLGINLLVRDVRAAAAFQAAVFGASIRWVEDHFALMAGFGSTWLLHSDHSYRDNALIGVVRGAETRGAGVELRLYGCNPDSAEALAPAHDGHVLAGSMDKPHGLRECVILCPEGYAWVPSVALTRPA